MNQQEIAGRVHLSMYRQLQKDGVATPVQVLMDVGVLSAGDYENWRFGRVDYLERVCSANLHKLSYIVKEIRAYARKNGLKESWTFYKRWGRKGQKPSVRLHFSKSGGEAIEKSYATHYISPKLTQKRQENGNSRPAPPEPETN
ncbi:hypothetical protein OXPF_15580 [Oxobacter pfennigii]|uniref:Uncharacterized protein n=1 Tax=Oxobacter pfennigii TaxID=36849 RepID=A0A0N8NTK4_9CLOT|nr:hypothetical protein [Oxobacter pfennigii]KPU45080.1 hypothetical protein OXPF_15580 [Oxobacter pfennigii]